MMASIMAAIPSTAAVTAVPVRSAALVCTIFPAGSTALICIVLPAGSTAPVYAVLPLGSAALVCIVFPAGSTALICTVLPASSVFLLSRAYLPVVMPALGFPLMLSASHDPLLDFPHGHSMAIL